MDVHLELRDVSKSFDRVKAVDGLSLAVRAAAVFGLLGPNGAGKTTTIRMIMRIIAARRRRRSCSAAADRRRPSASASATCPRSAASTAR